MTHDFLTPRGLPGKQGLYDPQFEHDACGFGFVADIKGRASRDVVEKAIGMLENMHHRGGCGCDPDLGDGAGILVSTPDAFFRRQAKEIGFDLPPRGQYAVAMMFLPKDLPSRRKCERLFEKVVDGYDMNMLGWRDVPVDSSVLSKKGLTEEPRVRQAFVGMDATFYKRSDFNRRLYLVRQQVENQIELGACGESAQKIFYINQFSTDRCVYKGMLTSHQLRAYYPDLSAPDFVSAFGVVHSRFSTNTFPSWRLAHPYRYMAHNGEINTLRGNRNWMRARYGTLSSDVFGDELNKLFPILSDKVSDSATLDNCLQFLCVNGRSLPHAMRMLIPEAWEKNDLLDPDMRAFAEYHAMLIEPWDGPAGVAFTNGHVIGAVLDRNGLRPARYYVTKGGLCIMGSEAGAVDVPPEDVLVKRRLQPGMMLLIDMDEGRIVDDKEIKQHLVESRPWKKWIDEHMLELDNLPEPAGTAAATSAPAPAPDAGELLRRQQQFGYTNEDLRLLMTPMAATGKEAIGSMGADTPLACLSRKPQPLYNYFKQLFAQVTNPPLDAIREEMVTSLWTWLGREGNLLAERPENARMVKLQAPVISDRDLAKLTQIASPHFRSKTLSMLFDPTEGEAGLKAALDKLCTEAARSVKDEGVCLLVLSDRGTSRRLAPIPSLLATAAVHHHLIREGTRTQAGLIIESGDARETHHFCCLIGYGAGAVNPYMALETLHDLHADGFFDDDKTITLEKAKANFLKAANAGILKVASKMGISTVQSYRGAQIFEAIGLAQDLVDEYFTGTASRLQGIGLKTIATEALIRHRRAYPPIDVDRAEFLDVGGLYQWRRDGEQHAWGPATVAKLQHAVRIDGQKSYRQYAKLVNDESRHCSTLRGLMDFRPAGKPVDISEVEPAAEIVKRFCTGAMSLGSISKEVHSTLAQAMNRIGGKSNTGEGGEDPERFTTGARSSIKQVASGRFGVTVEYLVNADELQIKVAQGAKPGEGGALAGIKVDDYIGKIRHSTPGVGLISPPPHHDIYSIEDLAQLIHDLKNVNPKARISVKLVSEVGVGTVATGVAKAKADHIVIAGDTGGTGNAALSSIKHCGLPWELGLAETQQTLLLNGLRGRVVLQADGGMKTGRDVVVAALLGAEEVGFSTAPLIAAGCIMMRVCHLNTCPVGIATQDPELRKKFTGTPENVVNFFFFIAEEVREYMAKLGFRTFGEMVGRVDCLTFNVPKDHPKAGKLDLSTILHQPEPILGDTLSNASCQDHELDKAVDNQLLELAADAIEHRTPVTATLPIRNVNRTVGTMLSGAIAQKHGQAGLPDGTIHVKFNGSAGQSFGCFLAAGVTFELEGDANDYLGKGLSGGRIIAYPPAASTFRAEENIIAGNVIGYGGIAGELYLRGVVGERFCVRNSGIEAVVEGLGDHGCEYMTGGRVVVIGGTGRNFAAGMSGGVAYVYDHLGQFPRLCNKELVDLEPADQPDDHDTLRRLLENHHRYTKSPVAKAILDDFAKEVRWFVKVMPRDYRRVLEQAREADLSRNPKVLNVLSQN